MRYLFRVFALIVMVGVPSFGALVAPASAAPGLIILEGSDAQTFHGLNPYSTNFLNGMATYSTAPTLTIGVLNSTPAGSPTVGLTFIGNEDGTSTILPSLSTMLATYSGLYIGSPFTCCSQSALSAADAAIIGGFVAAGRSLAIEDYQGGSQFDSILGTSGGANAYVAGLGGAVGGLGSCFDGNIVAAGGSAYGLGAVGSAIPNIGCFGHQAYNATFFDALGFTTHIADNPGLAGYNVVISNGGGGLSEATAALTGAPEPASMALLGAALAALGVARRRRVG